MRYIWKTINLMLKVVIVREGKLLRNHWLGMRIWRAFAMTSNNNNNNNRKVYMQLQTLTDIGMKNIEGDDLEVVLN